jgi:hypothetical protein
MSEQNEQPKVDVSVYGFHNKPAPAAATFRQGATDIAGIEQAADARRELSRDPVRKA